MLKWLTSRIQNIFWVRRFSWWAIGTPDLYLLVTHRKCGSRSVTAGIWNGVLTYQCLGCACLTNAVDITVITKEQAGKLPTDGSVIPHAIY
ncbi:hypothetical protein ACFL14_00615 [Patescibacteria group bacterium]